MLRYLIKRILVFIPTLIAISLLGFVIMVSAPGDPVERMVVAATSGGEVGTQSANATEQKKFWNKKLGLDLPIFYFSISSMAQSDTLYRVYDKNERKSLERLANKYGNWEALSHYYSKLDVLNKAHVGMRIDTSVVDSAIVSIAKEDVNTSYFESSSLKGAYSKLVIEAKLGNLEELYGTKPYMSQFVGPLNEAKQAFADLQTNATPWKKYVPVVNFYPKNQYHRWIFGDGNALTGKGSEFTKGIVRGDFGTSYTTKMPVSDVILSKFFWSFFFTMVAVTLGYLVSIPLGIYAAVHKDSKFDKITTVILFMLYSPPSFWIATMALMTFANPDVIYWFPASGVEPLVMDENMGFFARWMARWPYLVIPTFAYTYSAFAFLSRTMRVSMLEIVNQDYIRTARAKGLSDSVVIWKHGLRNALLPIITVFANIFPVAIGGSVVLEVIFTIPGMGNEMFNAIVNQNYPMIITVLTITGVLTLVGYLVSDILYAVVDPRISYSSKS